ncbi:putative Mce family protein [Mycolicibacterium anyangense]|uniref:Putative Mce family protein n=1 Tax=Mycolicibacterium anyangense TaxID=1431246 RepID=A0A6N4VYN6_9MYCO|nr:MlaD family protein [Mycolicibacterium anyangense]BBZ74796.1 putative Mce family protein [Mycolicibacterium anyangense]
MTPISTLRARLNSPLRATAALAVVAAVAVAAVTGAKFVMPTVNNTKAMCAELSDAVGLYVGNKVALLGIDVGSTTSIENKPDHVQVDFTVPADLDLPADVGVVTYSQSIVTDRHIELTKAYTGGPKFAGPGCIKLANTRTPISVSETFAAVGNLADTILGPHPGKDASQAPGVQAINNSLSAASRSLNGTGTQLNETLRNLVTMLADPYQADTDYRRLFENSEIFTSGFLKNWDTFASVIQSLPAMVALIEALSDNISAALANVSHLLPILVEASTRLAPRLYRNIGDKLVPWIRDLLNNHNKTILSMINTWPQFTRWFTDIYETSWGTHNVTYIPPQVSIAPTQAGAICEVLKQRRTPGAAAACASGSSSDPVTLGLTDLILGAALG